MYTGICCSGWNIMSLEIVQRSHLTPILMEQLTRNLHLADIQLVLRILCCLEVGIEGVQKMYARF